MCNLSVQQFPDAVSIPRVVRMIEDDDERKRRWFKPKNGVWRRMMHLWVDSGANSAEEFAADLLEEAIVLRESKAEKRDEAGKPRRQEKGKK